MKSGRRTTRTVVFTGMFASSNVTEAHRGTVKRQQISFQSSSPMYVQVLLQKDERTSQTKREIVFAFINKCTNSFHECTSNFRQIINNFRLVYQDFLKCADNFFYYITSLWLNRSSTTLTDQSALFLVLELVRQPVQSLVQPVSARGAGSLNVPVALTEGM